MKNKYVRGLFCLTLSMLFHIAIFIFIFANIAVFPAQSRSEYKILAEVMMMPAKRAENPGGRNNAGVPKVTEESEAKIQEEKIAAEPVTVPEAAIPEVMKPAAPPVKVEPVIKAEPKISPARKQPEPKAAARKANTPKKADVKQERVTDNAASLPSIESSIPSSVPGVPSVAGNAAKPSQERPVSSIAAVESVVVINRVKPTYPAISRKRREEGNVVTLASVVNGKVVNVTVEKSSGIKALDASALSAVGKWSFSPDTNIVVRIPVSFELKD
ncbi:MAG: TonB family protein [Synergistaceae bacterium]|nr:TonB family protein [Synergistaceae bacterium]